MKQVFILLFAATILLTYSISYAQTKPRVITLSMGAGHYFFDCKRELKNNNFGFAALGYNFSEKWGIEATGLGSSPKMKDADHEHHGRRSASLTVFTVTGLYRFAAYPVFFNAVEPYVFAGVGITGLNPNHHDANNEGNVNGGLGVQAFFQRNVAIRADVRDIYTMIGNKNDVIVDVGLHFQFC